MINPAFAAFLAIQIGGALGVAALGTLYLSLLRAGALHATHAFAVTTTAAYAFAVTTAAYAAIALLATVSVQQATRQPATP
ncbi:MAG: hypothetical protein ACR2LV_05885 [Solirubrobacteraceae bacterium]